MKCCGPGIDLSGDVVMGMISILMRIIEALGDIRAGLAPSDRLFVQLLRDERDIAAMFLVDMSNSTEGWVGVAVKEALVLLAEALEVVGDRYGIYGFSGMRRSRSETLSYQTPGGTLWR